MKQTFQSVFNRLSAIIPMHEPPAKPSWKLIPILCGSFLLTSVLLTRCKKDNTNGIDQKIQSQLDTLDKQASSELQQAWQATSKYQDIKNAYADKYADIHVVMPNMGYHYMKSDILDSVFDAAKPELLVYNKKADSSFQLVAIEYAVPLDKSVNAPEGFPGNADVWEHNTSFGLWLLHAWVWSYNPAGIFHPTNPNVIVR
ncbi:MAG: hypothetical protein ABI472_03350 [Ginsengibacter sp.]